MMVSIVSQRIASRLIRSVINDEYDLQITESQAEKHIPNLPEAFKPEMLATLEKQCRDFFR